MQQTVVGVTKVFLNGTCKFDECNLGNFLTDAMVFANAKQYRGTDGWTDAAIGFYNSGGIRSSCSMGNITMVDLLTALPMADGLLTISVSGQDISDALEHSVHRYNPTAKGYGEFLQMSGVQVTYNVTKPIGNRVHSVHLLCVNCAVPQYEQLEKNKIYKIIISTFLQYGGNGYNMFMVN